MFGYKESLTKWFLVLWVRILALAPLLGVTGMQEKGLLHYDSRALHGGALLVGEQLP